MPQGSLSDAPISGWKGELRLEAVPGEKELALLDSFSCSRARQDVGIGMDSEDVALLSERK